MRFLTPEKPHEETETQTSNFGGFGQGHSVERHEKWD